MSDINFLDNKKQDEGQKLKDNKKNKLAWSNSKREAKTKSSSFFSFLPFMNKVKPVVTAKDSVLPIDQEKIKKSREEILNSIKSHKNLKSASAEKDKKLFTPSDEKIMKQPKHKDILIDYQRIFNQEKEPKGKIDKIFNIKPALEIKPAPGLAEKNNWLKRLTESIKRKIIARDVRKNETAKIIELPKVKKIKPIEIKSPERTAPVIKSTEESSEIKVIKAEKSKSIYQNNQRVIETNLIQGELVTFFNWRSNIITLASAILIPIFFVGMIYYGLLFYQKNSQSKNLMQAQKFAELEKNIAEEESGLGEIQSFQARLKVISQVFKQHLYWTNFFKFLEDNTIKDVYFEDFDGDTNGHYVMQALTTNYGDISEQVNVFKNSNKIVAIEADGGEMAGDDLNKNLVSFNLNFTILKNIFIE